MFLRSNLGIEGPAGKNSEPSEKVDKGKGQIVMLITDSMFAFQLIYNTYKLKQIVATLYPFPFSDLV